MPPIVYKCVSDPNNSLCTSVSGASGHRLSRICWDGKQPGVGKRNRGRAQKKSRFRRSSRRPSPRSELDFHTLSLPPSAPNNHKSPLRDTELDLTNRIGAGSSTPIDLSSLFAPPEIDIHHMFPQFIEGLRWPSGREWDKSRK